MTINNHFSRNVWCLLGLPFDAVNLEQATSEILSAAHERRRCFLSTPNLNWLCAAQADDAFRDSVINSDLSIADGLPIVVIAKLLGIPLPERVAGSDLIDRLFKRNTTTPLKVFFFGGEPGVGDVASEKINQKPSGLIAVGNYAPGFGSVEEMSAASIIDNINRHDVEFLIVSLGAKKGQAWIEKNKSQLNALIMSHLGAVINFYAGTVKRAPLWMQNFGFEWLWRIIQEPKIWQRYFFDGLQLIKLLVFNVLPYAIWIRFNQPLLNDNRPLKVSSEENEVINVKMIGPCTDKSIALLKPFFNDLATRKKDISLDLQGASVIDGAFLGLCLLLLKALRENRCRIKLVNVNKTNLKILRWSGASYLADQ